MVDYYLIQAGPFELRTHQCGDVQAVRVARRWTRMFFRKAAAALPPWSVSAWMAREDDAQLTVYRYPQTARGVYSMAVVKVYEKPIRDLCSCI